MTTRTSGATAHGEHSGDLPPRRYAPGGPDAETLDTGDSGPRIACGVVERRGG